jgi:hypothetical protein
MTDARVTGQTVRFTSIMERRDHTYGRIVAVQAVALYDIRVKVADLEDVAIRAKGEGHTMVKPV